MSEQKLSASQLEFIEFVRPAIEASDDGIVRRISPRIDAALVGGICTRDRLARAMLDSFPDSRLAENIARKILSPVPMA